ncbi:MAG: hypothetical protein EPN26_07090 [Rhodospirillales bacterium]|nr:MAG: hypothetical protein EPN26_07090 [Rhodospirillales bacterium]
MRKSVLALCVGGLAMTPLVGWAQDVREVVPMPPEVQHDMLIAMRDHVIVIDTIFSHVATERYREAALLAEERLRASPFDPAKEAAFATYMTADMKEADAALRQSAKGLALAIRRLDTDRSYAAAKGVSGAISNVTAVCVSCHARNRLR